MAIVKPFKAVRPAPEYAARVASLPYDVMNTREARQMVKNNPDSFLHVSRAEIDLPEGTDEHSKEVYEKASANFQKMMATGVLQEDETPHLYIYSLERKGHTQTGLVACCSVEDYFNGVIKKHELTRPEKEKDRIDHMTKISAHVGPIFLTYRHQDAIDEIINRYTEDHKPVYHFRAEDGVSHTVWVINENTISTKLTNLFQQKVPYTYIADGHHRTASAAKLGKKLAEKNPNHTGNEEYNFFLSVLFPDNQLQIMEYNRLVKDLNGLKSDNFLAKIEEHFYVRRKAYGTSSSVHEFRMYLDESWYLLTPHDSLIHEDDLIRSLDVSILKEYILQPLLGIKDERTDKRIDFVGGIRGFKELEQRVDSGEMKVGFALYPITVEQLIQVADSGTIMPPKSTWFEPKLRDGLFAHLF